RGSSPDRTAGLCRACAASGLPCRGAEGHRRRPAAQPGQECDRRMTRLSDFDALSFDCYGTLIDWETGLLTALRPLSERSRVTDGDLLEHYGVIELEVERENPGLVYSQLLERVHAR